MTETKVDPITCRLSLCDPPPGAIVSLLELVLISRRSIGAADPDDPLLMVLGIYWVTFKLI